MTPMPNQPKTDDELREQLRILPASEMNPNITTILSEPTIDAILSLIHQRETALLERVDAEVIGASPDIISVEEEPDAWLRGVKGLRNSQRTALAAIKKEVGGK